MRFRNLGLTTKITVTTLVPGPLVVILSTVGVFALRDLLNLVDQVEQSYKTLILSMKVQEYAHDMKSSLDGFLLTRKESDLEPYKQAEKHCEKIFEQLRPKLLAENQKSAINEAHAHLERWIKEAAEPSIKSRKMVKGHGDWEKFDDAVHNFRKKVTATLAEQQAAGHAGEGRTEKIMVLGTVLLILLTFPLCYLLARSLAKPLSEAVSLAEGIARGDLSRKLIVTTKDEIGKLGEALNHMVDSLKEQTLRTLEGASVLASSATEISTSVAELASSATETSSAVTETVTTVEELQQTARLSSEKARKVAEGAHQAAQISDNGEKAIEDTVQKITTIKTEMESIGETVQRLSEQSQSIEDIVNSVRDLADQSNLLAVNASIEAAKAGEQGKGFAVVAAEIKILADRSREATEQIRSILEDTRKWIAAVVMATEQGSKAVASGVRQSRLAGDSIRSLCKSVLESAESATIIQASNEQQAVGVEQVSNAMAYIDQAVRQNVAGATQLEDAPRQISDLGNSLKELVERYKM